MTGKPPKVASVGEVYASSALVVTVINKNENIITVLISNLLDSSRWKLGDVTEWGESCFFHSYPVWKYLGKGLNL